MSSRALGTPSAVTVAAADPPSTRPDDEATRTLAHHNNGKFRNPWESSKSLGLMGFSKLVRERKRSGKQHTANTDASSIPFQKPQFLPTRDTPKLRATWLGHACYLVEFPSGLRVLFDPVFTDRCSPFQWLGPKRYTPQPCQISDIPYIDAVCISHSHYDHLSHPTVTEIHKRFPHAQFFVGLGLQKWFHGGGIKTVTELDWWDDVDVTISLASVPSSTSSTPSTPSTITARISCLPNQHSSGRGLFDRDATLWSSWGVRSGAGSVYFAGDTGYRTTPQPAELPSGLQLEPETSLAYTDYVPALSHLPVCPAFAAIGAHRGPFDLGLIPIGAYTPRNIMSWVHADPRDAVRIFKDTRCKRALGMHWATWVLTEEDAIEPRERLKVAVREEGWDENVEAKEARFGVCGIGESREF